MCIAATVPPHNTTTQHSPVLYPHACCSLQLVPCVAGWYSVAIIQCMLHCTATQCLRSNPMHWTALQSNALQPNACYYRTAMQRNQRVHTLTHTPGTHKMGGLSLMSRRRMSASGVALIRSVTSEHLTQEGSSSSRRKTKGWQPEQGGSTAQRSTGSGDLVAP